MYMYDKDVRRKELPYLITFYTKKRTITESIKLIGTMYKYIN